MLSKDYWWGVKESYEYINEELGIDLLDSTLYLQALEELGAANE